MKKTNFCAVLAAGVLAAALAAGCGSKKADATTAAQTTAAAAETAADSSTSADGAMVVNEVDDANFQEGDLKIPTGTVEVERKNADGVTLVQGYYELVAVPDALKDQPIGKALEAFNKAQTERANAEITAMEEKAAKDQKEKGDKFKTAEYDSDVAFNVQNQDFVSINVSNFTKVSGEENTVYYSANYATGSGNELKIADVVAAPDKLAETLSGQLIHENSKEDFGDVDVKAKVKEMIDKGTLVWNLDDDGAVFTFAEGTVAPKDNGEFTVKYLYAFTPEFFKSIPDSAKKEIADAEAEAASEAAASDNSDATGPGKAKN